ncbi:MAG: phosphoribosyl-AMP cyclohydrolase [Candidatus Aceula meridiana]|nr:phosphoribosyl-AMP cyclohydrolase [Candidatus Aceula meridiana]
MIKEEIILTTQSVKKLKFNKEGLIPAIVQDYKTKNVLMLAYMNLVSLKKTIKDGKTCFWSRSRKEYWTKGMTSGHFQFVKNIYYDCDLDTLLIAVRQVGGACHTGKKTCFYRKLKK